MRFIVVIYHTAIWSIDGLVYVKGPQHSPNVAVIIPNSCQINSPPQFSLGPTQGRIVAKILETVASLILLGSLTATNLSEKI
jgi:hypothetical protein